MTTHDEQPSPLPAGTWEIDWIDLGATMLDAMQEPTPYGTDHTEKIVRAVITEYRRQQAAQGIVEVRREDLDYHLNYEGPEDWGRTREVFDRLQLALDPTFLAAAKDQDQ